MKKSTIELLAIAGAFVAAYYIFNKKSPFGMSGFGEVAENLDVSRNEDLAGGCAHLISLEEHLSSSLSRTGDKGYLDQLKDARAMRREAMAKLMPRDAPGENWCITKHLLGGSMRMAETAAKLMNEGDEGGATVCFKISSQMKDKALNVASQRGNETQCSVCQGG